VVRNAMALIEAMRQAVGEQVDIMIDNHGRPTPGLAIKLMRALEPYHLKFFEEPVPPDNLEALAKVAAAASDTPLATGERLFTKWGFRELLERQLVEYIQPDICHDGGIFESRVIAAMAETYYVRLAPHNPNGPVATAASVHLAACSPNFDILEYAESQPFRDQVLKEPWPVVDGYLELPTKPGLGVELNEEAIRSLPFRPRPYSGIFNRDGSVADI
jgi:galactonate dehydratase